MIKTRFARFTAPSIRRRPAVHTKRATRQRSVSLRLHQAADVPVSVPWVRRTGCCCRVCVVDQRQFINFVRQRGLAVIATRGADGAPQAALIGITATERGELVFDTSRGSRKYHNLSAFAQVALVIGWDNEMTVQCEGTAEIPTGADHDRCL
jgi:hypothetical protein